MYNTVFIDLDKEDSLTELTAFQGLVNIKRNLYIPSRAIMNILDELAPEFKVRFKTEKAGATRIVPISSKEFFEGEKIFDDILKGMDKSWRKVDKIEGIREYKER